MRWFLNLLYVLAGLAYLPVLAWQMIVLKKNRRGWRQRLGFVRRRVGGRPCVWVHGVSLGEVNATRSLVAEIHKRLPAYDVVISATTDTGFAAAVKQYAPKCVFRYPLDFSFAVGRAFDRLRPDAVVLMELEVWPNLVAAASRRGIPIAVANGRVTEERSMRRYRLPLVRGIARRMFGRLAWVGAQDETYAARFVELGVLTERVSVTGTMKYDTALVAERVPGDEALARAMAIDAARPLIVAGSTGPGEEELVLDAFETLRTDDADVQLAIIPRKPERFDEVARLIERRGFACRRRSEHPDLLGQDARDAERERRRQAMAARSRAAADAESDMGEASAGTSDDRRPVVILGDTMGELRKFYALATVVFVGRTLVPLGGSDLMEVAGLSRPMCFGPYTENFADAADKLLAADAAVRVEGAGRLASEVRRLLADRETAAAMGRRAQDVVRKNVGATKKTVDLLCESLGRRADHPESSIATARLA